MEHQSTSQPNRLIHATSPYLLQHAYNPVDWFPWGEEALKKAKEEDKPIIVSIGYSACHWCHVMERESFENEQIAQLMNQYFVNIKVDREERPDVDAVYMEAAQAISGQGGWPLNAFLTPDAKPFYAGTYFPPQGWANLLVRIAEIFQQEREELEKRAELFKNAIATSEVEKYGLSLETEENPFEITDLDVMFDSIAPAFDTERGGMQKAPKFPMPSIYAFLLHYHQVNKDKQRAVQALNQVNKTLEEMAFGGIYDQIGGGFARYSVDADWFAPHFEKMLYDNGQLISLYTHAYNSTGQQVYKQIVYETINFVDRELTSPEGAFYAALDADSEGEEGKFYIWTFEEVKNLIPDEEEFKLICDYYQIETSGNWEHNYNILHRKSSDEAFAQKHQLGLEELENKIQNWKSILLNARKPKIRPGLDDKTLTSWNALMLNGLVDAYRVFDEDEFLAMALQNAHFIKGKLTVQSEKGLKLWHTYKNGKAHIDAYLEDYALLAEAYINLYQATFDQQWIQTADQLMQYCLQNFYDTEEEMFFFTDKDGEALIARKKEVFDNVIPASNSVMAKNLYLLSILLDQNQYQTIAQKMVTKVKKILVKNVEYLANWGQVYALMVKPIAEIVIVGEDYQAYRKEIDQKYFPNKVILGSKEASDALPLLSHRSIINNSTTIYVCYNKTCQLPVNSVEEAWQQILF